METNKAPTYLSIAQFVLPLSLTNLIITLSHSVVNAGVARTPDPEIALAAYALAKSLVMLIENPMFMVRQTVASLVKDVSSFLQVKRFVYVMAGFITFFLAILGFTPLGFIVLTNIMGASDELARQSHLALAVLFLLPITTVSRNVYHGVAIIARQTIMVPLSTAIRLIMMTSIIFGLALYTELPGAVSASLAFVGAFFGEALIMRWRAKPLLQDPTVFRRTRTGKELTTKQISRFFLPLMVTTFVSTAFGPLINTGLARTVSPEVTLAAYSVGLGIAQLILAPLGMLHQCTLSFTASNQPQSYRITKIFTGGFALCATILLAVVSFSPVGPWILAHPMGLTPQVAEQALMVMRILTLKPFFTAWREYLWGILMQQKLTDIIGKAKAVNLVIVIGSLVSLLALNLSPAAAGALALVMGELADCIFIQLHYRRTITNVRSSVST